MVNSLEFKKSFEKKFKIKVECIYNPFDKIFIRNKIKDKIKIRFFKKNYLNIVSVGRLTDQKDHITLLRAISLLRENFKIKLIIIGKGEKKKLTSQIYYKK